MHIQKAHLFHATPRLIPIRAGMDHKDGKVLPQNTTAFTGHTGHTRHGMTSYIIHFNYLSFILNINSLLYLLFKMSH